MAIPMNGYVGASGFLIFVAGILLLISTFQPAMLSGARTATTDALSPVLNIVSTPLQNAALFVRDVTGLAAIQAENARLSQENVKLREWYQTALLLEAENKSLRELMNVKADPQKTFITTRILSDSSSTFAKSLLVAAGSNDGIREGQAVMSGDGLIGRVVETGTDTARVLLINDMNSRVPVIIENTRQHAIFAGQNNRNGFLMHLPPETHIKQNVRIVTSGVGGVFPAGLPVGIVKSEKRNESNQIVVEPFADFNRLMHVRIIDTPIDPNLKRGILNGSTRNATLPLNNSATKMQQVIQREMQ